MFARLAPLLVALPLSLSAAVIPAVAEDANMPAVPRGLVFKPQLTNKNVTHDPLGVWPDSDLLPRANLFVARVRSPRGDWILSIADNQCSMQGDCQALLALVHPDGTKIIMANPSLNPGWKAVVTPDFKKIYTQEMGEGAKPFTGSYDIGIQ